MHISEANVNAYVSNIEAIPSRNLDNAYLPLSICQNDRRAEVSPRYPYIFPKTLVKANFSNIHGNLWPFEK